MKKNQPFIFLTTIIALATPLSSFAQQAEFTVSPVSLYDSIERNQTSTKIIKLYNNGPDDHHFTLKLDGGPFPNTPNKVLLYSTSFEDFEVGALAEQSGWYADCFWKIESTNPATGGQHLHITSDSSFREWGTYTTSTYVWGAVATKTTAKMKINLQGSGVTWTVTPQSAGPVVTTIVFGADGTVSALVSDSPDWVESHFEVIGATPTGYFDLGIEVDRESAVYSVYLNGDKVFTGQGVVGDMRQVAFGSVGEVSGPTMDIDDLMIIDGTYEELPEFLSATPAAGFLPAGDSVEIEVSFNAIDRNYGTYESSIEADIDGMLISVPAKLRVYGEPQVTLHQGLIWASSNFKGTDKHTFTIDNTGGNALIFNLVIKEGAESWLSVSPTSDTLGVGERATIEVSFDASSLGAGGHYGYVIIYHNSPPIFSDGVSVWYHVNSPPDLHLSANSMYQQMRGGEQMSQTFRIENRGEGPLQYTLRGDTSPWLSYDPKAGEVSAWGSTTITVNFDAAYLGCGIYYDTLHLSTNDPNTPDISIPIQLRVILPLIGTIDSAEVIETGSLNVTFTATGPEDASISVVLNEFVAFITPVSSGNGTATYSIKPTIGDAGEYDFDVVATANGQYDTATFHLSVVPYGVQDLSLIVAATDHTIATFSDSLVVDVADPAFNTYTIRANTNPAVVGSLRFWVDDQFVNNENEATYVLTPSKLGQLSAGYHTLVARAFTKASGGGTEGKAETAVIKIINSAAITDFDVVKHPNTMLMDLIYNDTIDISQPAYKKINVRANTSGAVKSVVFSLNGSVFRYDNAAPFQLNGVNGSNDLEWPVTPGVYTVTATPYSKFNGQGIAGTSLTVKFYVVNGAASPAPHITQSDPESSVENIIFSISPVPTKDRITISVKEQVKGNVGVMITSSTGIPVFITNGDADNFRSYHVNTNELGMASGLYLIEVRTANGMRALKRVVKE